MRIGVLALQGDVAEHRRALEDVDVEAVPVRRTADLRHLEGIVLPGGESTTMSVLLDSAGLREPLAAALGEGLPAFGTCAGLILLASDVVDGRPDQRSFGVLDAVVRRNGYGRQAQSFECDVVVEGLVGPAVHAVFIRAPVVESVGSEVRVLARTCHEMGAGVAGACLPGSSVGTTGPVKREHPRAPAGLRTGDPGASPVVCLQGSVLVTAFHPELTEDRRLHRLFAAMVRGASESELGGAMAG